MICVPPLPIIMNEHVHWICHGAEPLRDLLLRHSERQSSHVDREDPTMSSTVSSTHARSSSVTKIVVRKVSSSSSWSGSHSTTHTSVSSHSSNVYNIINLFQHKFSNPPLSVIRSRPHTAPSARSHHCHWSRTSSHGTKCHLLLSSPSLVHAGGEDLNIPGGQQQR